MSGEWFVRLKNELMEIILTIKQVCKLLMMMLNFLWIVITFQEENWINKAIELGEQDRKNINYQMPNEFIQGSALTVKIICFFQRIIELEIHYFIIKRSIWKWFRSFEF
jgi:hypothetical protein